MSDNTLYREMILDHSKRPRNMHELLDASNKAHGKNSLCGDDIYVYLKLENDKVADISFSGEGCAICTASASLMTWSLKGLTLQDARKKHHIFHQSLTAPESEMATDAATTQEELGKLSSLLGVRQYPIRVKCATLPWHTFVAALNEQGECSTE